MELYGLFNEIYSCICAKLVHLLFLRSVHLRCYKERLSDDGLNLRIQKTANIPTPPAQPLLSVYLATLHGLTSLLFQLHTDLMRLCQEGSFSSLNIKLALP